MAKRALAFSCDGELAVAADDSVHVFIPEFPDLRRRIGEKERKRPSNSVTNGDDNDPDEDEERNEEGFDTFPPNSRAQYSEGSKHMPVSYPPFDPRINRELFAHAGVPFPYDSTGPGNDLDSDDDFDSEEDDSNNENGDADGAAAANNRPYGAGYGPITGVGSSMNHVVRLTWSPSDLGINRRSVLTILTGSGVVAMYGDGNSSANILPRANEGMLQRRELNSWIVLWGVGERLMVPGQQTDMTENIQAVAWAKQIGPGRSLLATINDIREIAIISVQTVWVRDEAKAKDDPTVPEEGGNERFVWLVREVARFKATGPHPKVDVGFGFPPPGLFL